MPPITVLVVDAAEPIRHDLRGILRSASHIDVVGESASGVDAVLQAEKLRPDVVLIDAAIAEAGDCDPCRRIRELVPESKFLFLLTYEEQLDTGLAARADGYWLKDGGRDALVQAIRSAAPREPGA
ncbi:MAG: response regulator transcription factor [Dehalococcoidia bacterium]|nr:response regulator transcription factor [Dehalococcoidia bacterium]